MTTILNLELKTRNSETKTNTKEILKHLQICFQIQIPFGNQTHKTESALGLKQSKKNIFPFSQKQIASNMVTPTTPTKTKENHALGCLP
jgi:hypothetical protein